MDISMDDFLLEYVINNNHGIFKEDIVEYKAVTPYDLVIEFKNGERRIYDTFSNTWSYVKYESDDLTDEQELHEFQVNLKTLMRRKFVDQTELARRLGVSQGTISKYTTGHLIPDVLMLRKMARALGCSVNDFFYKHY